MQQQRPYIDAEERAVEDRGELRRGHEGLSYCRHLAESVSSFTTHQHASNAKYLDCSERIYVSAARPLIGGPAVGRAMPPTPPASTKLIVLPNSSLS